jgi:hypothetical protein
MKFAVGITALLATGACAFSPSKAFARSSSLYSTTQTPTYTFTKSEEIFAEAQEVRIREDAIMRVVSLQNDITHIFPLARAL